MPAPRLLSLSSGQFYSPRAVFCEYRTKPQPACVCGLATIRSLSARIGSARKYPVRLTMGDSVPVPVPLRVYSPKCVEGVFSAVRRKQSVLTYLPPSLLCELAEGTTRSVEA